MALGDSYAILTELKSRLGISDTNDDTALTNALAAVSRGVERFCGRQFNDAGTASARTYRRIHHQLVRVEDFHTTTDLVVATDEDDDGTFETTWASSDFQLEPLNGIVDGETGWPFWKIRAVGDRRFPTGATVSVTARWGWATVPVPVKEATLVAAEETFKLKDAPFGVAGFAEFGAVRVRDNPKVAGMLRPYRLDAVPVA